MVGGKIETRVEFEYCRVGDDVTLEFEETIAL
jgi:hypothetical protein